MAGLSSSRPLASLNEDALMKDEDDDVQMADANDHARRATAAAVAQDETKPQEVDIADVVFDWIRGHLPSLSAVKVQPLMVPIRIEEPVLMGRLLMSYSSLSAALSADQWEDLFTVVGNFLDEHYERSRQEETKTKIHNIADVVFAYITETLPGEIMDKQDELLVPTEIEKYPLLFKVQQAYPRLAKLVSHSWWDELYAIVVDALNRSPPGSGGSDSHPMQDEQDLLEKAFTAEFQGHAHSRLFDYIESCWKAYTKNPAVYSYPYIAIVQSSGFGKSRLLRECAVQCETRNKVTTTRTHQPKKRYHLLYVCARDVPGSSGFPLVVPTLLGYLFPRRETTPTDILVDEISRKLVTLFDYVMNAPLPNVDKYLLDLFSKTPSTVNPFLEPTTFKPVRAVGKSDDVSRMLIVAVDEARALLPKDNAVKHIGYFRCFRRALFRANTTLRGTYGRNSGVFGIVVDTNSIIISTFVPSSRLDPSKRVVNRVLFPPFVITDTVDVLGWKGANPSLSELTKHYKDHVLKALAEVSTGVPSSSWEFLKLLGRPLWGSREELSHVGLISLAAEKILGGGPFSLTTLHGFGGVASAMCRLGLRPYMSTPLATQFVADFMAVLSYVGWEREQFFVSYSSDPILSLGATKVWHGTLPGSEDTILAEYVLRRLKLLLPQEVLDTGGVGELVARVVLLLVMDSCAVLETNEEDKRWKGAGEFYKVTTFLRALEGTSVGIHRRRNAKGVTDAAPVTVEDAQRLLNDKWKDWFVSFTHFVQLSNEPNEECLWALLGRRAAAILPRGHKGADFLIPICRLEPPSESASSKPSASATTKTPMPSTTVSMILVQVKNHERGYSSFCDAVTTKLDPAFVFSPVNDLSKIAPDAVVRVLMSLREPNPRHAYVRARESFALCLFGLEPWSSRLCNSAEDVCVVSPAVSSELNQMLGPWWRVDDMVGKDMASCPNDRRLIAVDKLKEVAMQPLGHVLVLNEETLDQL